MARFEQVANLVGDNLQEFGRQVVPKFVNEDEYAVKDSDVENALYDGHVLAKSNR